MVELHNPILPGFFTDPSICRVEEDYYIANSSFEWFPGVAIHHLRDLVNWRFLGHALTRKSQLDLSGIADSAGVWASSFEMSDCGAHGVTRSTNRDYWPVCAGFEWHVLSRGLRLL